MTIRPAKSTDIEAIYTIYEKVSLDRSQLGNVAYETEIQKKGFLLGLENKSHYEKWLQEAYLFLVVEEDGKIIGYIVGDHREKYYDDEYKTWFDEKLKDLYYHSPHAMTVSCIALDPEYSKKGIASGLLTALEEKLRAEKYKYLFSIITMAPVTNCPSLLFHTKKEFRRIAMGRPRRLFELDNYVGILLCKNL